MPSRKQTPDDFSLQRFLFLPTLISVVIAIFTIIGVIVLSNTLIKDQVIAFNIFMLEIATRRTINLTDTPAHDDAPRWSRWSAHSF